MSQKYQVSQQVNRRIPIARIQFPYETHLFELINGKLVKIANAHIEKGSTHDLYSLNTQEDIVEIANGHFVKGILHNKPIITFGQLQVLDDRVRVCSKNGAVLRTLTKGQLFDVRSIRETENGHIVYGINEKEFISYQENIQFLMGEFIPDEKMLGGEDGSEILLEKGKVYGYDRIIGNQLYLHNGIIINIDLVKGYTRKL